MEPAIIWATREEPGQPRRQLSWEEEVRAGQAARAQPDRERVVKPGAIVRNEATVLRRCLESARPWIDHWIICDTGSTDGTPALVREALHGILGELHHREWVNFGHNRSQAIALARGKAEYHLLLDADMTLHVTGEFRERLAADAYLIRFAGDFEYYLLLLVSDRAAGQAGT